MEGKVSEFTFRFVELEMPRDGQCTGECTREGWQEEKLKTEWSVG